MNKNETENKYRITESQLILPALYLMVLSETGFITTADLIKKLEALLKPTGKDAEIAKKRKDTKFSQKVRNLKSHNTLENKELSRYIEDKKGFEITEKGKEFYNNNANFLTKLINSSYENIINKLDNILFFEENIAINEGRKTEEKRTIYKRSQELRKIAFEHHQKNGTIKCNLCNFDFFEHYGEVGKDYIEIHHVKPLYTYKQDDETKYISEAIKNTVPLCSNCHSVIHRRKPCCYTLEEMKEFIDKAK